MGRIFVETENIVKISGMKKVEYDRLIEDEHVCRIAFKGDKYPYIAPFVYVFDGKFMYFLSTKYGKKIRHFERDPHVSVEVERYAPDLSSYQFVTLRGKLIEVSNPDEKRIIRERFMNLIKGKNLSKNIMTALGHSPQDPVESILEEERSLIWKLSVPMASRSG